MFNLITKKIVNYAGALPWGVVFIHLSMTNQYKSPFNKNNEATIKNR